MDLGAELTLQICRLMQEHGRARGSRQYWTFMPEMQRASWDEARERLLDAPKPLIVAPLLEPGMLAIWSRAALDPAQRAGAELSARYREEYLTEQLLLGGLDDTSTIRFPAAGIDLTLSVPEFRQWYRDYDVAIGISLGPDESAGAGRLLLRVPGGGAPFVGGIDRDPAAAT
jgi:hypothetical protein